jgi:hypothetical protein
MKGSGQGLGPTAGRQVRALKTFAAVFGGLLNRA